MPTEARPVALPVETERLLLRAFEAGDLESLLALHGDPELVRWIPWGPRSPAEVQEVLERKITQTSFTDPGGGIALAAARRVDGAVIGEFTLANASNPDSLGEIGFMLRQDAQGLGYATEGAREVLRIAFDELGLHRVIGRLEARNAASGRVLERLGMRLEAHLIENEWVKGEWQSELAYALLESEWRGER